MKLVPKHMVRLLLLAVFTSAVTTAEAQNVIQKLKNNGQTTYFAQALEDANLQDRLNGNGPFTLFVPSNSAFGRLSSPQQSERQLLLNHVFMGMATERSLRAMSEVTCLSGKTLKIKANGGTVTVNSARVVTSNIRASNGVIHIIDGVIK